MLRKLGTPQTIDPLGQAALDKAQNSKVRLEAIKAIGAVSLFPIPEWSAAPLQPTIAAQPCYLDSLHLSAMEVCKNATNGK